MPYTINWIHLILQDFPCKTVEWHLADKKVCAFLVAVDFAERNSTRMISVRLLDPSGFRGISSSCLGGKLFWGSFSTSQFASSLFHSSHFRLTNDTLHGGILHCEACWHSVVCNGAEIHESLYIGFSTFWVVTHAKISAQHSPW
jgi:hypothetical protein